MLLFAKQFVGCVATAEDVVQDGFLRFWKGRKSHPADRLESYLYGCIRWAALDLLRRSKRSKIREETYSADEQPEGTVEAFECPVESKETAALVSSALEQLNAEQREVVVLKVWAGLTLKEIGEALEISPNTVSSRYRYALEALRKEMGALER